MLLCPWENPGSSTSYSLTGPPYTPRYVQHNATHHTPHTATYTPRHTDLGHHATPRHATTPLTSWVTILTSMCAQHTGPHVDPCIAQQTYLPSPPPLSGPTCPSPPPAWPCLPSPPPPLSGPTCPPQVRTWLDHFGVDDVGRLTRKSRISVVSGGAGAGVRAGGRASGWPGSRGRLRGG